MPADGTIAAHSVREDFGTSRFPRAWRTALLAWSQYPAQQAQYQVQPGQIEPISNAIWLAFHPSNSERGDPADG